MQSHQITSERDVTLATGIHAEPIDRASFAGTMRLRQAARARKLRAFFVATGCQYRMTFEQFRQQGVRNRILRDYGMEAIFLPHELAPQAPANDAKRRRRKPKRQRRQRR